jgi:hypothetical protein
MYSVLLERAAEKDLSSLPAKTHDRVVYEIADVIRVVRVNRMRHRREVYR